MVGLNSGRPSPARGVPPELAARDLPDHRLGILHSRREKPVKRSKDDSLLVIVHVDILPKRHRRRPCAPRRPTQMSHAMTRLAPLPAKRSSAGIRYAQCLERPRPPQPRNHASATCCPGIALVLPDHAERRSASARTRWRRPAVWARLLRHDRDRLLGIYHVAARGAKRSPCRHDRLRRGPTAAPGRPHVTAFMRRRSSRLTIASAAEPGPMDLPRFRRHLNASGRKPGKVRFRCPELGRRIPRSSVARRSV